MIGVGAQLKWWGGKLLYPAKAWDSPSKRRLPRILVENRAMEVGIYIYIEGNYVVFEESKIASDNIPIEESEQLEFYQHHYQLIPERIKRQDAYEWMKKHGNAILVFGKDFKYYYTVSKRP